MSNILERAIDAVKENQYSFCKFITPNDAGDTGAHQAGLYIPKNSIPLLFDSPGHKGENKEKFATITWQDGRTSECRFIYYGKGSRNEYRITRLGRHFEVGDFVLVVKESETKYLGFVFSKQTEIKKFLNEFDLSKEDTNSLILTENNNPFSESAQFVFKPRARIIKIIGQELISNDVIALVELIKNSYDADALNIEIELNDIFSENGEIIIKDDGLGMSYEKIINVWLEPATPDKKNEINARFSKCYLRRLLGEKGIGRFAAHRLGDRIELITRAKEECNKKSLQYETKVKIDWTSFSEEKYLDEVPITVSKNSKKITFPSSSGTLIKISNIQPWKNIKSVRDAVIKIKGLESPVKPMQSYSHKNGFASDPGITISIVSNDSYLSREISELKSLSDLLSTAFYQFDGHINSKGIINYNYKFNRVDQQEIKRTVSSSDDLKFYDINWFEEHPLNKKSFPGEFEVTFYAWDLDTAALKVAGLADYYRNIIRPNSGVRIYRDNFRVWPYGEEDNDWLNLDLARLNAPKERSVSRNQIFGIVHISSEENPSLKDQSNREGLISNEQFDQFYHLVNSALSLFAKERKIDKIKIDKVSVKKQSTDVVTDSINELRSETLKNGHNKLYDTSIDKIENNYRKHVDDILERYMMAAAIGISYSIPIHEMKLRLTSIENVIDDIERNAVIEDKFLRELAKQLNDTKDVINAVSSIMSRQKTVKVNLTKIANNTRILKESDFKKYNIDFKIKGLSNIEVEAVPGLLNTAVLNLVDNAIYWLRAKQIIEKERKSNFPSLITLTIGINDDSHPFLQVADNGNGFGDPFELLIEPYYSKKHDGLGLGLYLVNEIMIRLGGKLIGYNDNGAVFTLIFK